MLGALRVKHFLMCLCACAHKPLHVFIYMAATYQRHWARQPPQVLQICANCEPLPHPLPAKKKKKKKKKKNREK